MNSLSTRRRENLDEAGKGGIPSVRARDAWQTVILAASNLGGQVVLLVSLPLLLRLYGPRDFGQYSLVVSVVNVLLIATTFKLELVVPTVKRIGMATQLTAALFLFTVFAAFMVLVAGLSWQAWNPAYSAFGVARAWLPMVVGMLVLLGGLFLVTRAWLIRQHAFLGVALMQLARSVVMVLAALGLASLFPAWARQAGGLPLLLAAMMAGLVAVVIGALHVGKRVRSAFRPWRVRRLWQRIWAWRRHLSAVSASQILHQVNLQLPLWGIAWLFGATHAGWLALALRVVMFPVQVAGGSLGFVMSRRLASLHHGGADMAAPLRETLAFLLVLGILGYGLLAFLAPRLIVPLFGEQWSNAITTVQATTILGLGYFVNTFTVFVPILLRQERFLVLWNVGRLLAFLLVFGLGYFARMDYLSVVLMLSAVSLLFHALFGMHGLRATADSGLDGGAGR